MVCVVLEPELSHRLLRVGNPVLAPLPRSVKRKALVGDVRTGLCKNLTSMKMCAYKSRVSTTYSRHRTHPLQDEMQT
jgi:hypothetical protein